MPHAPFPNKVVFPVSAELVSFHEAGHAVAAVSFGVLASAMHLFDANTSEPHGKSTLIWNGDQREAVACGGFAAERYLFDSGRLVDSLGCTIKESDFINFAIGAHAAEDKIRFFGKDHSLNGYWPVAMDQKFMAVAKMVAGVMRFDVVTAIAEALLAEKTLSRDQIADLIRTTIGNELFDQIDWRVE